MNKLFSDNIDLLQSNEIEKFNKMIEESIQNQVLKKYYLLGTYHMSKSSTSIKSLKKSISMFYDVIVPLEIDLLNKNNIVQNYSTFTNSKTNEDGSVSLELALTELQELGVLYSLTIKLQKRIEYLSKIN